MHPNTLRLWDDQGRLRAVRLGTRRDRRYEQAAVATMLASRPESHLSLVRRRWAERVLHHRLLVQRAAYVTAAILLFAWGGASLQSALADQPQPVTVLMAPQTCQGWSNARGAIGIDVGEGSALESFTSRNSAIYDAQRYQVRSNDGAVATGSLDGAGGDITCTHFSSADLPAGATITSASVLVSMASRLDGNTSASFSLQTSEDGAHWTTVQVLPVSAEGDRRQIVALPKVDGKTVANMAVRIVPDIELGAAAFTTWLDAVQLQVTATPLASSTPRQDAKARQELNKLVSFSKEIYKTDEHPVVRIPKSHPRKFMFITTGQTTWGLVDVQLADSSQRTYPVDYHERDIQDGTTVDTDLLINPKDLHPGKYKIKVTMRSSDGGSSMVEKDFFWGVVALNFDRAAPQQNDRERVGMGILDDTGRTICDAEVTVQVRDPRGHTTTYRTSKRSITKNPNCIDKGITNEPDYHFDFTVRLAGTYHVTLRAKTDVGERVYEDNLFVTKALPFDVERSDYPTRINPYAAYPVRIAVTPSRDYAGPVYERVPADFKILNLQPEAKIQDDPAHPGMKRIYWQVEWKRNTTYYLSYRFVAPPISPALFMTGPLSIGGNDLLGADFIEPRQWQIASDSISSISWDGSASNLWSNPANWSTNVIPQAGDNLVFPAGAANYSNQNDLGENYWFNSITFYDSGYTLSGNTIIMGQGQTTNAVILPGITDAVSSGGNTISLPIRLDATRLITVTNSSETLTISGAITGVGGLSKEGLGDLVLSGGNTYGGVTKVNGGVLSARNNTALGTIALGTEVVGEAALELEGTIAIGREALTLRSYGQSNGGALRNVQNNNSFDGLITIAGTTEIASDSGTLTLNGGVTGTFNLNLDGSGNISFAKAPIAISTGLLTKNGGGTTTFNFPNTYTGVTTVNAGTLLYGCDNAILSGNIVVNGGTLDVATFSDMVGAVTLGTLAGGSATITGSTGVLSGTFVVYAGTISAIIAGDGTTLTKQTPGTVTLTRANQFTGAVTLSVGILKIQDNLSLGTTDGVTTLTSGATLQIDGNGLSVPELISVAGLGLNNVGALVNSGGDNTITGLITMTAATTIESAASTTLTISNSGVTGAFGLTVDGDGDTVISAPINTSGGTLTKDGSGNLTLSAYNPYTGATVINYGNLRLNGNGTITTSASIDIRSGSKLILDNSSTVADRIGDAIGVTMNGGDMEFYGNTSTSTMATAGTLTLNSGQNTISVFAATGGPTILRFGSLVRTTPGATGLFRGTSLGATPAANVATLLFTTAPTLLGDDGASNTPTLSIIPGIFGDNSTAGTGTDMVTYGRGNNNGVRLLNGAGFSGEYTTDLTMTNANIKLTAGTAAVTTQINSLILGSGASITNPGSAQTMTFMSGNILNLQSSGSIAGANTTLAGGTLEFIIRTPQDLDISALITTTGGLSKSGSGTLTFSSSKTYTGLTSINAGTLLYGAHNALSNGAVTINDATLNIDIYSDTVGAVIVQGGTITGDTGVLTATSYDFRASTASAYLDGSGTLTVSNTNERVDATSTFTRDNPYTGAISVASGVLKLGADGGGTNTPLGTTAAGTTVSNGAMLDLNGHTLGIAEALNFRGTGIAGQGAIINSNASAVTYSGALTISTSGRIGADYGKITITGSISGTGLPLTVGGFGDIDISGAISTGTSGSVTKDGFGTYTPSNGNSTYTGATTISAGKLKLGAASVGGTNSPLGTAGGATAVTAGATLDLNGYTLGIAEAITNLNGVGGGSGDFAPGALINSSGTPVTFTGTITIAAGTMIRADSGAMTLSAISGTNAALILAGNGGGTVGGVIGTGTGTLSKLDSGTWNLAGSSTYTGATFIYQGTIQLGATGGAANTPLGTTGTGTTVYSGGVLDLNGFTLGTLEAFTLNGFGIADGGCVVNSSGNPNFSGNRTLGSDIRVTNTSGSALIWSGTSTGVFETRVGGSGDHTLQGVWAAAAATVWKDGAGIATVNAAQGWTGNTTVIAGTFRDGALNGLSSGNVVVAGGTFDLSSNNADSVGAVVLVDGTISTTGGASAILTGTAYTIESGTISGVITGAVAMTKNTAGTAAITAAITTSSTLTINAGTLTFSGNGAATTVTGATINLGGTLTLDNSGTNVGDRLSGSGNNIVVTMNGGNFNLIGKDSTTVTESIGQLAFAAGHNVVTVDPKAGSGGSGTTLTVTNATCFNRTVGATVLFRGTSFGSTPAAGVSSLLCSGGAPTLTGANGGSNNSAISILKGAFGDNSVTGTGTDMVTYNQGDTTGLRLLNGAGHTGEYATNFGTNNANVKITGNTAAATQNVNSLIVNGGDVTNPGSAQTITTAGGSLAGNVLIASANTIAGANTTFAFSNGVEACLLANAPTTISASLGNTTSSNVTFSGSGNITISAANTYTGTTFINSATLTEGTTDAMYTGPVTLVGGTFDTNGNTDSIGGITMTAGVVKSDSSTLTTTGTFATIANANLSAKVTGTVALPASSTLNIADGLVEDDAVISAVLTSANTSLSKSTGTGVVVFSGNNTYTGPTTINAGTIKYGTTGNATNGPLGTSAGATTVANGAALDLNGYSPNPVDALTISGAGLNTKGALLNTSSTAVTYSALLSMGAAATIQSDYGDINISNTGTITGTNTNLTLRGAGNGTLSSILGTGSGTQVKNDMGTWTVSGNGTFTGVTTITLGVLKLGAAGNVTNTPFGTSAGGVTVAATAMLDLNGLTLGTAEALTIAGTGLANAGALTTSASGSTSYSGAVTLGATPRVTNYGSGTFTISGAISGNNALTVVSAPGTITIGTGVWSGSGSLVKEGWGTTIISGQNTMTGAMTVSTGTLQLGASGGGTNSPVGTNAGGVSVSAGAVFDTSTFQINNAGAGSNEGLTLNGSGLKNAGALITNSGSTITFSTIALGSAARIINSGGGTLTFSGAPSGAFNFVVGGSGNTTFSTAFPNAAATITKWGAGTMTITGTNLNTGLVQVNAGTLKYAATTTLAAPNLIVNGGTFDFNGNTDTIGTVTMRSGTITDSNGTPGALTGATAYELYSGTISGVLTGGGVPLNKRTGGTVTVTKSQSYTNLTTVLAGTLQYGASNIIADAAAITVNGGTLDVQSYADTLATVTLTNGYIIGGGTLTGSAYNVMSGSISAILAGAVNLTKTTGGTVTLSGTNTFSGITTISGGTLSVGSIGNGLSAGNLGAASNAAANIVFNTGTGTLAYTGGSASTDRNITTTTGITMQIDVTNPAAVLTWSGATTATTAPYTKIGPGTLILSGSNLHTGLNTVLAGTLKLGAANVLVTGGLTVTNGTFDLNNFSDSLGAITISKDGQIIDSVGTTAILTTSAAGVYQSGTISARITGSSASAFTKSTSDRVILSGNNTHTSTAVTLSAGALNLQHSNALGISTTALLVTETSGAVVEVQNTVTIPSNKTFNISGTGVNLGGAIENVADSNTLQGTITLGASNTRINSNLGTLTISGNIAGNALNVVYGGAGNIAQNGTIGTTSGTLTKDGTGILYLPNANTYTGLTTINAGIIDIQNATSLGTTANGTVVNSGATLRSSVFVTVGVEALTLNGTGVSNVGALQSYVEAVTWQGAVTLASNASIGVNDSPASITGTIIGSGSNGLTKVGSGSLTVSTTTLGGDLTISAGTLVASGSSVISVGGSWSNSGTFTANSSTVSLTSTTSATITGNTTFNNFSVTGIGAAKTISFVHGSTTTVSGTWTVNGGAVGTRIVLTRDNTSNWNVNPATAALDYVDISYVTNQGSYFCATHSVTANGGNANIGVTSGTACGVTVSGFIYTNDASSALNCTVGGTRTVAVKVNGSGSFTGACSSSSGDFTVSAVPITAAGDVLTVFISGATEKAATVTIAADNTSDITNIPLRVSRLVVTHESAGPITNHATTGIGRYDKDDDATNLFFTANSNNLVVDAGYKLMVNSGKTYTPGGNVTTGPSTNAATVDGDVNIPATSTLNLGTNTLSVGGHLVNAGTLNSSAGSAIVFTSTASGTMTITGGGATIYDLTLNNASGHWTNSGNITINGNFNLTAGEFIQANSTTITVNGTGFTLASGSTWTKATSGGNLILENGSNLSFTDNTSPKQNLGAVQIGASPGTTTLTTDMSATSVTIPNGDTFNTKGYDVTTTDFFDCQGTCILNLTDTGPSNEGDGTVLDVGGDFSMSDTATFTAATSILFMNSTAAANSNRTWITGGKTYNHVELKNAGTSLSTIEPSGDVDVNGDFTITDGYVDFGANPPVTVTTAGNVTIVVGATVVAPDSWTFDGSGTKTWTDGTSGGGQNLGAVAINGSSKTVNLGSDAKATTVTIAGSQTLGLASSGYTLTITGSGTAGSRPFQNNGTLNEGTDSTVKYTGTATTDLFDETYYHLTLAPASGSPTFNMGPDGVSGFTVTGTLTVGDATHAVTLDTNFDDQQYLNDVVIANAATWNTNAVNGQSMSGSLVMNGTLTINDVLGFTAATLGHTISGSTLNSTGALTAVVFDGVGGGWTIQNDTAFSSFNIIGGSVIQGPNVNITVDGAWAMASGTTFTKASGSGTVTFIGTSATTFTDSTASKQNIGDVFITKTHGTPSNNKVTLASSMLADTVTVSASNTLDLASGGYTLTVANVGSSADPLTVTGTLTASGSSTVALTATNSGGSVNIPTTTYYALGLGTTADSTAETYVLSGNTTVSTVLTVGNASSGAADAFDASSRTLTLPGGGTPFVLTSQGTFTASSSTVNYTGGPSTVTVVGATYNNLGVGTTVDITTGVIYQLAANTTVSGVLTVGNTGSTNIDTLDGSSRTLTLSGSGTPFVLTSKGAFALGTSTVLYSGTSATTIAATQYYSLTTGVNDGNTVTYTLDTTAVSNTCATGSTGTYTQACGGTLAITTGDTLTITGVNLSLSAGGTLVLDGTMDGTGTFTYFSTTEFPSSGTVSVATIYMNLYYNDVTLSPRTYGGDVLAISFTGSNRTLYFGAVSEAGSLTIGGSKRLLLYAQSTGNITLDNTRNNWNVTIGTDLQTPGSGGGTETILAGSGTWTASGNVTFTNGIFTAGSSTLTMNGTSKTLTSAGNALNNFNQTGGTVTMSGATTVNNNFTITSGTLTAPSAANLSVGGDFNNAGTFTHNSGTVIMTGTSKNITGGSATTFNNLQISGTTGIDAAGSDATVAGTLTVDSSKILTINTGRVVTHTGTTDVANSGTIQGAGTLRFTSSSTGGPGTGGAINSIVRFDASGASIPTAVVDARTYGGDLEYYSNVAAVRTITPASTTHTVSGNLKIITGASQTSSFTVAANTNNPTFTIAGNLSYTKGASATPAVTSGSGTWTVSGDATFTNGTYTPSTNNTFVMDGSGKTVASTVSFYKFTSNGTITSTGNVSVANILTLQSGKSLTVSGTLNCSNASTIVMTGATLDGAGTLIYQKGGTGFPTDGTLNIATTMFAPTTGAVTIPSRTYGGSVVCEDGLSATTCTLTGTPIITGNLSLYDVSLGASFDGTPTSVTIGGNFSGINNGGGNGLTMAGTWTVSGDFDMSSLSSFSAGTSSLVMNGATKTLTTNGNSLYDFSVSGGSVSVAGTNATVSHDLTVSSGVLTAPTGTLSVGRNFAHSGGTFTHNNGTVALTTSTAAAVSGSTTFKNLSVTGIGAAKTITFTASSTQTVTGTWTVTGASGQIVTLQSSSSPTKWNINPTAASVSYAAVTDSDNQGVSFCATFSTGSSNTGWSIGAGASCGITVSGTVYQSSNEGSGYGCNSDNLTMYVAVNGDVTPDSGLCNSAGGTFTITGVTDPGAANIPIAVYIDTGESVKGTTVTLSSASGADISGLSLMLDRLVVSQQSGTATTNSHLNTADNGNAGIRYAVSGGALTVDAGMELHVLSGKTFTPGGAVTTTATGTAAGAAGDVHIAGTLTMGTNALNVGGDYTNAGTFNKTNTQTTTFAATGSGFTVTPGTGDMNAVTFSGDSGGNGSWTITGSDLTVDGALTVNTGDSLTIDTSRTLTASSSTNVNNDGTITGAGVLKFPSGAGGPDSDANSTGTYSSIVRYDATNGDVASTTIDGRTYSGRVELVSTSSSNRTITLPSTAFTVSGGSSHFYVQANGTGDLTAEAGTNNPTMTVGGALKLNGTGGGNEVLAMGDGTWTVTGDVDLAQGFTAPHVAQLNPVWDNYGYSQDEFFDDGFGGCNYVNTIYSCGTSSSTTMDTGDDLTTNGGQTCPNLGSNFDTLNRAYLKYDLSSISNTYTVTALQQQVYVTSAGSGPTIGRATSDTPNTAACEDLYNVSVATPYNSFTDWGTGSRVVSLPTSGAQAALGTTAFSLVTYSGTQSIINSTDAATNKPVLRIGYYTPSTSPTLIMNGTGVTLTANGAQPANFYNLTLSGTVTVNLTTTVYVFHNFDLSGTVTNNTAALVMTGVASGATLSGHGNTIGNMSITDNGNVTMDSSLTLSSALVVYSGATLTLASGQTLTHSAGTFILNGTIAGPGLLTITNSSSGPGSTGTLNAPVQFDATAGNIATTTFDARTYNGAVELYSNSGSARSITAPTSGTYSFASSVTTTSANTGALTWDLDNTTDPTVTITGATSIGSNTTLEAPSSTTLTLNGNYTNSGTFTDDAGTVAIGGGSPQTLGGTLSGSSDFNNLTITNTSGSESAPGVVFSAAVAAAGTLTANANTKLQFLAGTTSSAAALALNGTVGNMIYLRSSSPGSSWNFNKTSGGTPTITYTNIRDSYACGSSGGEIDASDAPNGSNVDYANNTCWLINTISLSISDTSVGFGSCQAGSARYATGDTLGASSDSTDAHTVSVTTNARNGYTLSVQGATLTSGGNTISAIGGSPAASNPGSEQFGLRAIKNSGTGTIQSPYNSANWGYNGVSAASTIASHTAGVASTVYGIRYICNINALTEAGNYSSNLTYVLTGQF